MTDLVTAPRRPWILAIFLVVAGAAGWWAAFNLTLDKFLAYEHPKAPLSCDFSLIVQCTANLNSPQGSAFGFPNPIIGLGGFAAVIAVGVSLLAGAQFARWYWIIFNLGIAGALAFVIWLMGQSIFDLNTLCPWCMVVWAATIPLFWAVTIRNLAEGVYGGGLRRVGTALRPWIIPITVISYLIVAVVAQLRLDVLAHL
ncbi:MAG: vitamin K epoxide reductase family protein [Pseudolysinimonas sp.]